VVVAIVGAGLSGAACARALTGAGVPVEVHDRARVPGGRMASRHLGGRYVDLGASYLTTRDDGFRAQVDDWVARGLAHPWTDAFHVAGANGPRERKTGPLRYGTAGGLRSLVADLLDGICVRQESVVASVGPGPTVDGRAYGAVVLALPDPQAAPLLDPSLTAERTAVRDRVWEPVLALAAGFAVRTWDVDGCFVDGSDVLGWVADDGRRRGDAAPVLVAHSTSPFAERHLADPSAAAPAMLGALQGLLGVGPAEWTHLQRWTHARPAAAREEPFFLGEARVGLCGDGWGSPRVETAWVSGTRLGQQLAARL
jgi:predicted NAD/FAD-dependent oxidoreductase